MLESASVGTMISQSREVLTKPSVATFEKFEKSGGLQQALIYIGIAAAITGIFGIFGGIGAFISGILSTLIGFLVFTYLVFWIGKQQGGTGTLDEVAYTFALFWGPISVLAGVLSLLLTITVIGILLLPLVAIVALVAQIYFAYLAVQSSLNLPAGSKAWLVLILAAVGSFIASAIIGGVLLGGSSGFNFNGRN